MSVTWLGNTRSAVRAVSTIHGAAHSNVSHTAFRKAVSEAAGETMAGLAFAPEKSFTAQLDGSWRNVRNAIRGFESLQGPDSGKLLSHLDVETIQFSRFP